MSTSTSESFLTRIAATSSREGSSFKHNDHFSKVHSNKGRTMDHAEIHRGSTLGFRGTLLASMSFGIVVALLSVQFMGAVPKSGGSKEGGDAGRAGSKSALTVTDGNCKPEDRQPSNNPAVGRMVYSDGSTASAWIASTGVYVTAGHVFGGGKTAQNWVLQFNVPLSDAQGNRVDPPASDQLYCSPLS